MKCVSFLWTWKMFLILVVLFPLLYYFFCSENVGYIKEEYFQNFEKGVVLRHTEQKNTGKFQDGGRSSMLETSKNFTVIYDERRLLRELRNIHDSLYTPPEGDECKIRKLNCLIVGVAKSGTQELTDFMSMHPNIVIPDRGFRAYPTLFLTDEECHKDYKCKNEPKKPMPCTYSDQIGFAKSDYLFTYHLTAKTLYTYDKDFKIILMVREPIDRMMSAFTYTYYRLLPNDRKNMSMEELPSFDSKLVETRTGRVKSYESRIIQSTYDIHMDTFLKYFKREQILVIEVRELCKDPIAVARRVEEFLGIKHVINSDYLVYNSDKKFHCLKVKDEQVCYEKDRGRPKLKELRNGTLSKLKNYFRPHNERFFRMIGKSFDW